MDTAGKDGTIRHVFEGANPQGVKVASFKKPSLEALDHDYLWRIHAHTPQKGEIMIFNRSHYEDVLVTRVHDLVPKKVWSKRFQHINEFERMLSDEGAIILKFFLYIDKDEQKKRLEDRIHRSDKHWKLSASDLPERKLWDKYIGVYEEAIGNTSTEWAPWYVIPANRKWYRNLIISKILVETLTDLKMSYPEPTVDVSKLVIE
jgi:PPK2 family polyphosphate:nucleotide phosphotransferase